MLFNHENTPVKHLRFNWAGEKVETRKTKYYNFVSLKFRDFVVTIALPSIVVGNFKITTKARKTGNTKNPNIQFRALCGE